MKLTLKIWREGGEYKRGQFVTYQMDDVHADMSFLEMLDVLNESLIAEGKMPVAFEHDCREGICGSCGMVINGYAHGQLQGTTACQLHMRHFKDGDTVVIEPWRSKAFPVIRDLVVDRSSFDRIIEAGGYISVGTGQAPDGNNIPVEKDKASHAFDAATCIGCGACVAACPNASAMLFVSAKVSHLAQLPQGNVEAKRRARKMVQQMDDEGFGYCSNISACEAECPKEISIEHIARLNREYLSTSLSSEETASS